MTREHCDNCDVVLTPANNPPSEYLSTTMRNGDRVQVETRIIHPLTLRGYALCAACSRELIDGATPMSIPGRLSLKGRAV